MGKGAPGPGDYVWSQPVICTAWVRGGVTGIKGLADVRPGDIIQFRNTQFAGRTSGGGTYWMTAMHHTAVVATVDATSKTFVVCHQNWGKKTVRKDLFHFADLKSGWLRIYRPVAAK